MFSLGFSPCKTVDGKIAISIPELISVGAVELVNSTDLGAYAARRVRSRLTTRALDAVL